jgi:prepilin-type N-terminal cleavage/methylation domain-containing protein
MKILKNEKGFTLIELVLTIVILGILGAVATVQFGTIIGSANTAALDSGAGPYSTQLALTINSLKALPTTVQFDSLVFTVAKPSGGKVVHANVPNGIITMTVSATCNDTWTYLSTNGSFTRTAQTRTSC